MKASYLSGIAISVILIAGCATSSHRKDWAGMPPTVAKSAADRLWLISAVYGSGTNFADVSYRVDALLHQPGTEFYARPEWLHADPTPGWNKELVVVYEFKGQRNIFMTGEGGKVSAGELTHHAKAK